MNRRDLQALTFVGPPTDNPELDPLALLHLDNQVCMLPVSPVFHTVVTVRICLNNWDREVSRLGYLTLSNSKWREDLGALLVLFSIHPVRYFMSGDLTGLCLCML